MRIGANIPALYAHNNAKRSGIKLSDQSLKLSSGIRINSSKDDPSGLAIANKIRFQVRGLERASENSSNAVSFIQTAEGALSTVHDMLQRIRELSVYAANDTNEEIDRQKVQDEINQLVMEINDVSAKTEYNRIKMLNGECNRIIYTGVPSRTANAPNVEILRMSDSVPYGDIAFSVVETATNPSMTVGTPPNAAVDFPIAADSPLNGKSFTVYGRKITVVQGDTLDSIRERLKAVLNEEPAAPILITPDLNPGGFLTSIELDKPGSQNKLVVGGDPKLLEALGFGVMAFNPIVVQGTNGNPAIKNLVNTLPFTLLAEHAGDIEINGTTITFVAGDDVNSIKAKLIAALGADPDLNLVFDPITNVLTGISTNSTGETAQITITGTNKDLVEAMGFGLLFEVPFTATGTDAVISIPSQVTSSNTIVTNGSVGTEAGINLVSTLPYPITPAYDGQTLTINGLTITLATGDTPTIIKNKLENELTSNLTLDVALTFGAGDVLIRVETVSTGSSATLNVTGSGVALLIGMGFGAFPTGPNGLNPNTVSWRAEGNRITIFDRNNVEICFDLVNHPPVTRADAPVVKGINTKEGPLYIQIGANKDMGMYMTIPKVTAATLEIDDVDVTTVQGATRAIELADRAIGTLSKIRSKLGAYSNRLEYTVTSLDGAHTDASQSLSRVEDTDMALTMTEYSKEGIVQQAAMAMIAQANQRPQSVLQLIQ